MKNYIAILEKQLKKYQGTSDQWETLHISAENRQQAMYYARRIASVSCARVASLRIAK